MSTTILLFITILPAYYNAQVYFSDPDTFIYAKKNITAVLVNQQHLEGIINTLIKAKKDYIKNEINAEFSTEYKAFNQILIHRAESCIKLLGYRRSKGANILKNLHNRLITNKRKKRNIRRIKRGIRMLGNLISYVSGVPSPGQWENEVILVNKLENMIKNEHSEQNLLIATIKDEASELEAVKNEYQKLQNEEFRSHETLKNYAYFVSTKGKLTHMCSIGKEVSRRFIEQTQILEDIKTKSSQNLPSKHLFPINHIFAKIKNLQKHTYTPLLQNTHEIESLFLMATAITSIHDGHIYSVLQIPLVDFSYELNFIQYPFFTKNELEILENLSKISLKEIDTFLCSRAQKSLKVMSSKDLEHCLFTPNRKIYVCSGRQIIEKNANFYRPCNHLPQNIIIELSPEALLIKSNLTEIKVTCPSKTETLKMKTEYTILKLHSNCTAYTTEFMIHKHHKNITSTFLENPMEIVEIEHIPNLFLEKMQTRKEITNKYMQKVEALSQKIKKDIEGVKKKHEENEIQLNGISAYTHLHKVLLFTTTPLTGLITIGILTLITWYCTRRCRNPLKKVIDSKEKNPEIKDNDNFGVTAKPTEGRKSEVPIDNTNE